MPDETQPAFALDVDPTLIEAALASVDRNHKATRQEPPAPPSPEPEPLVVRGGEDFDLIFDPGEWGEPPPPDPNAVEVRAEVEEVEIPVDDISSVDVASPVASRGVLTDEDLSRMLLRMREQTEHIARLEARLGRAQEIGDGLDRQVRELRNAYKHLESEVESNKKRQRREREEAERRGEEGAVRALIEVADSLERAVTFSEADPTKTAAGLGIIREQFRSCLKRLSVERIDATAGSLFDPAVHEAILHLPTPDTAEGHVVSEVAVGFRHRGRLLRPARVVVAAPATGSPAPSDDGPAS